MTSHKNQTQKNVVDDHSTFHKMSLILYVVTSVLGLLGFVHISWLWWKRKYRSLPHAPNIPWLGCLPYVGKTTRDLTLIFDAWDLKYNGFYVAWIGPIAVVRVAQPDLIEVFLKSPASSEKTLFYRPLSALLGDGLLLSRGEKWKRRRAAITPSFHFSILKVFSLIFENHARQLVDVLRKSSDEPVEVQRLFTLSTLDVICESSMGVELSALGSTSDCEYLVNLERFKDLEIMRGMNPLAMMSDFYYSLTADGKASSKALEVLHQFTVSVINDRIHQRKAPDGGGGGGVRGDKKRRVLMDTLLDLYEEGTIDVEGIQEEIDTFMFAGKGIFLDA